MSSDATAQATPPGGARPASGQQVANYRLNGRVLDEKNTGLPGATVVLKGNDKTGTTSDADGKFVINIPTGGGTLVVSAIGYLSKEVAVTSESTLDIALAPDVKTLNEVVVVGYGTQKKENLTGAVAAINIDEKISSRSLSNVSSALSGLVPGLAVQQSTGQAGRSGASLVIRGLGTVNNAGPLIVVDGIPDVDINRIDMNDVASISVLKDAASASVYGSRAANGVVLITTKNGSQSKKAQINYTGTFGLSQPTNFYNYFDDYARSLTMHLRASAAGASATTYRYGTVDDWLSKSLIDPINYPSTNWWDVILRDQGRIQTHNLSASGSTDKANFYLSAGVLDELGILINHDFKRYNTRFNMDYKVRDAIKVGVRLDGQWSKQDYANAEGLITYQGTAGYDIRYAVAGILPKEPETGRYGGIMAYGEDAFARNMLTIMEANKNKRDRQELNANLYGEWSPIEGLTLRGDYGLRYYNQFTKSYSFPTDEWNFQTNQIARNVIAPSAGISNAVNSGYKTLLQGRITYNRTLFGNHQLSLLGAYNEEYWFNRNLSASRQDRINPLLSEIDAALTTTQAAGGNSDAEGLRSGIGRINYVINDRYLFEANARYDGSSKFLPGFQYGFFPSASVGWRISEEPFFSKLSSVVSSAKIRASIGKLGNNSGVGRYEQRDIFNLTNYILNGKIVKGFSSAKIINEDFSWEETNVTNVGLDLSFFGGRLTTEIDAYNKLTSGMIRPSSLSTFLSGYSAPRVNIGKLRNVGLETNITYRAKVRDANVGATLNLAFNRNRLLEWNEFLGKGFTYLNMPYHFAYSRVSTGIAQTWEDISNAPFQGQYFSPGDILYKDMNGDGQVNDEDRVAQPRFNRDQPTGTFGLNLFGNWRGFDVSILWQGATGRKDFWLEPFNQVNIPSARNAFQDFLWYDTWTLDNRSASLPRLVSGSGGNNQAESTFWLDSFNYLRLKNIQAGYNIPSKYSSRVGIGRVRVYLTSENLLTFTKYRGVDPEKSTSTSGAENNDDPFPLLKSYSFGLNISL
ncbi:SusC/RagA family TonB-linked outer membrane protein [Rudanella paleaurantiibacter]|uniref:SusC/RagA family TonB-linked outer membrane protein n=1 Tax=Rudanella paleaurantiibacter TaxID=2614655 RepID=A0A7J5U667_9BACT|nr:TonB-dependent receptor [Rudanella paleaurantiibacter]KAB7733339.1 SusC/RagA family TonB-linked outer membrane protein [Rudanella paleaurantiibacter]